MSTAAIVGILVALVVVGGVVWFLMGQRRRTEALQARYGPEYSRTVSEVGDQRRAEEELLKRQERVEHLEIKPLLADQRDLFGQRWRSVQAMFVDDPGGAVSRADDLVEEVMKARGYPVADFDQRAADLSVHHAHVIENYRGARDIAERHRRGVASTEDLRQAMVFYRELFEDLLEDREHGGERAERAAERAAERGDRAIARPVERDVRRAETQASRAADNVRAGAQSTSRNDRDVRP
jgi:hypothetical protein